MYSEDHTLSENHAFNGLSQLPKLIRSILEKKVRNVTERENIKRDVATIISNCLPLYLSGLHTNVYPIDMLVLDLCSLAILEVEENEKRTNRSNAFQKISSFELTISTLHKLCDRRLLYPIDHFLQFVYNLLSKPFIHSQPWMEDEITSIVVKFVVLSISAIPQEHMCKLWSIVWSRFPHAVDNSTKSCGNYLRISISILKHISKTELTLGDCGKEVILNLIAIFFASLHKTESKKWRAYIEYVLQFSILLLDDWGIECRDQLLEHCLPLGLSLVNDLDFSSASLHGLSTAWAFFDRLFHLAVPDCKASTLVPNEAYFLAQTACEVIVSALSSTSISRSEYVLQEKYIPLFARLILIADNISDDLNLGMFSYTKQVKRHKLDKFLDIITEWTSGSAEYVDHPYIIVSWLCIGNEILSQWSDRLDSDWLVFMATKVWAGRHYIKFDWQIGPYCQLLDSLLRKNALDNLCNRDSEVVKNLWKFALSSAHTGCNFDQASSLMISLIERFRTMLGNDEEIIEVICDILSRSITPHNARLYEMVKFLLIEFEFDEFMSFYGATDKKKGVEKWKFRCQVAEWLLTNIASVCNLGNILFILCNFHPSGTTAIYSSPKSKVRIEEDLELFGLITRHILPKDKKPTVPCVIIREMVGCISDIISQCWFYKDLNVEKRISLWCSFVAFLSQLGSEFYTENTVLLNAMNNWMKETVSETEADILSKICLRDISSDVISIDILNLLATRLVDCPALASHLVIHKVQLPVSSRNIRDVMRSIGHHLAAIDSFEVRHGASKLLKKFIENVDTVPDLLLLLDECGYNIESGLRNKLAYKILDVIDSDVATNEYDVIQADIYRKLLATYLMKSSEPGACPLTDYKTVSALCLIRYIDSLPSTVVNWEFVSNLINRIGTNVIAMLKLVNYLLSDPTKFSLHWQILSFVLKNKKLFEACGQLIQNFYIILDCHYNHLMLTDSNHEKLEYSNVTAPLRNDFFIQCLRNNDIYTLSTDVFPAIFFLNMNVCEKHAKVAVDVFWHFFKDDPHLVLTLLWKAVNMSVVRNAHLLLTQNVLIIAQSPQRRLLSGPMNQGFVFALCSIFLKLICVVEERNHEIAELIYNQIEASKCLSFENMSCLTFAWDGSTSVAQGLNENLASSAAEKFLGCGYVEDIRIFHCALFWQRLRTLLEVLYEQKPFSIEPLKNIILSRLFFAWDTLPHFRHLIAPIFSLFDKEIEATCISSPDCYSTIRIVQDFCCLMISNPKLESADVFYCCLRILSRNEFAEDAILFEPVEKNNLLQISNAAQDVSQLQCSLFRDLVTAFELSVSDNIKLFSAVSKYIHYMPKLSLILSPYILQMDNPDNDSVVAVLLQHACLITQQGSEESIDQCRISRCLAECVDRLGLERLSRVKLEYQLIYDGLCALVKCCLLGALPNYAFAVANVLYDMLMANENTRCLATFDGGKLQNMQFSELLREIYLALKSTSGLNMLPMELQNDIRVRILFLKARFDWLGVISTPGASLEDLVDAYWYCGIKYSGNCRRLKYALAIRTSSWSDVSYPKKLRSHEECLFAILYTAGQSKKSTVELLKFVEKVECESAVKDELPRLTFAEFLRDLAVFHTKYKITETESMTDNRLLLFVVHCLRLNGNSNTSKNFDQQLVMISALINRLVTVEAFFPCLTLLENCPGDLTLVEKCRVLMLKGDLSTAEHILRYLLNMSTSCELEVKVKALCLLAELLADRRNMLDEAVSLLRRGIEHDNKFITSSEHRLHIFSLLHRLAARQLSAVEEHMESRAFRMRKDAIREWTRQRSIVSLSSQTKTARRIESELKCEKDLVESISLRLVTSALNTVVAGLETLKLLSQPYVVKPNQTKEKNDEILRLIFPLIDIIFRFDREREIVNAFREYVASDLIPAVWLQVVNHVMVQCFSKNILASVIRAMVVKLIIAYPFHVLHTVLMYKYDENNAHIVDDILEEVKNRVTDKSNRARLCGIIEDMTSAHTAYIQFATLKTSDARYFRKTLKGKNVQYEMLESLSIMRMSFCLRRTPLPIVEQKVGFAGDYSGSDIVMWGAMESICTEANGLSAPKVLRTKGSDGKWYKLIWKNEDVRQDCLVEQLFSIVNGIMNHGNISSFLRTYKVVPLDSKCGIIEFCQGTISLKDLLCGMDLSGGLHVKAEPQDKKPLQIRCMLKDISKMRVDEATVIFRKACEQFQPVFRHYFYNNCRTIKLWLKMIDNYRCSLAQWSIVTYVVGIGDRHLSNILFETDTCKLVHIDLGMILEYSKRSLPIPERVPFRLTRDLLDPILIEGVSGGLLDEAVRVMRLMRENKEVILGFASVLLRETITNFEEVESNGVNCPSFVSETAIARLRDKLNGTDDSFGQQDVPHQVRRLFAEATNISNISRMFVGWMAFV